jgi:hypothetical protein
MNQREQRERKLEQKCDNLMLGLQSAIQTLSTLQSH